jgi:hypothetical protein
MSSDTITLKLNDKCYFSARFLVLIGDLWDNEIVLNLKHDLDNTLLYKFKNSYLTITVCVYKDNYNYQIHVQLLCIGKAKIVSKYVDISAKFNSILLELYDRYNVNNSSINYPLYQILECCNVYEQDKNYLLKLKWREFIIDIGLVYTIIYHNNERVFENDYKHLVNNYVGYAFTAKHYWRKYVKELIHEIEAGTAPEIFYSGLPQRIKSARN